MNDWYLTKAEEKDVKRLIKWARKSIDVLYPDAVQNDPRLKSLLDLIERMEAKWF